MTNPLSFPLLIALCVLSFSKPSLTVFVSINCGSSESFTDKNNIRWSEDDAYIQNGESQQLYSGSNPLHTLRVFPTGKTNCYTINVPKQEKILARASFYYGNYDHKYSPPTFDLLFEGNYWATVNTSTIYYDDFEVIYVTKRNFTSICVAQTNPNQLPFISSLEIRSLDTTMYSHVDSNQALVLQWRNALGGKETIRYPADIYDRIWKPAGGFWLNEVKSEISNIDTSTVEDRPPKAALQNVVASTGTLYTIQFINRLPSEELPVYINTYFSEITENAFGKRSIQMYIDNKPFSGPIIPPVGSVKEVCITDITASANTSFVLQASDTSILPPILNALEVYTIVDALNVGTDTGVGNKPNSPIKRVSPPSPQLIYGDEPNSSTKRASPPRPPFVYDDETKSPIKQSKPPPPPQLIYGDEPNSPIKRISPPPPKLIYGEESKSLIKQAPPPPQLIYKDKPKSPIKRASPPSPRRVHGNKPKSPIKQAPSPSPLQLIYGDEPKSPIRRVSPPPPSQLIYGDKPKSPIKQVPPPPPPLLSGDKLNNSPPLSGFIRENGSSKNNNNLSMLSMAAMQTLLSLLFMKFI